MKWLLAPFALTGVGFALIFLGGFTDWKDAQFIGVNFLCMALGGVGMFGRMVLDGWTPPAEQCPQHRPKSAAE